MRPLREELKVFSGQLPVFSIAQWDLELARSNVFLQAKVDGYLEMKFWSFYNSENSDSDKDAVEKTLRTLRPLREEHKTLRSLRPLRED